MQEFLFSKDAGALAGRELSSFEADVVISINNAKECLYPEIERKNYVDKLITRDDLSKFYNSCLLAILCGYRKRDISDAVLAALGYVRQIKQISKYNEKIVKRCTELEACLETYDERIKESGKNLLWFHLDVLLANLLDFSEIVIKRTANNDLKQELEGLLFRARHMRVILPQNVPWNMYITKEQKEAAVKGFNLQSEGSAVFLEISIFRLVYASRATFQKHPDRAVKVDRPALLSVLGAPCVRDFYVACVGIVSGKKPDFKDFMEKTKALIRSLDVGADLKKECAAMVFPRSSFEDFLASDYSKRLFLFERVLGGFVRFLNDYDAFLNELDKKYRDTELSEEIQSFRLLLLALIVLRTFKGMPKN